MGGSSATASSPRVTLPLRVLAAAEKDIGLAARSYNAQLAGLGDGFVTELDSFCTRLRRHPQSHSLIFGNVRRAFLRQFPVAVFYRIRASAIEIVGVFHFRLHWAAQTAADAP